MSSDKEFSTLDEENKDEQNKCPTHCNYVLEFYCRDCKKNTCMKCESFFRCFRSSHDIVTFNKKTAVDDFNHNANELIKITKEIDNKLEMLYNSILNDTQYFIEHLERCKKAILDQKKILIKMVENKSKTFMSQLEEIQNIKEDDQEGKIKILNSMQTKVHDLKTAITAIMNKPEETETLESLRTPINDAKDKVFGTDFNKSFRKTNNTGPKFIPFTHLDEVMTKIFGKITIVDSKYTVAKDDEEITATIGQPFSVKVSSLTESEAYQLTATLTKSSGEESNTKVDYLGSGEYKIISRCNMEGDWQMNITTEVGPIKRSPVHVTVEKLGLVHTIGYISDYQEHNTTDKVTDVLLDRDGHILVACYSKDILKFIQSDSIFAFDGRIRVPEEVAIYRMHQSGNHKFYSDNSRQCVVMCNNEFQKIRSLGEGILDYPEGLTVNNDTRVLYVADREAHCVFKFNVDDGSLLGMIGSRGSEVGQMNIPQDVALTKEGHVIVADCENCRIQMFDANGKFIRIVVDRAKEDGKVWGPCGVTMDMDENIIVSSNHKLQLFDKNGVFIKRIDHKDDGLIVPIGVTVISNRPRRVAVANHKANNIKIFNY